MDSSKMRIKQNKRTAMYDHSSYGPTFGGGHDFRIYSDANNNSDSWSILGHTYELPPGQTDKCLVGSNNFNMS